MQRKEIAIASFDVAVDTIFQIFGPTFEAEDTLNAELQVRKCLQELLFQQELSLREKGRQELAQQQESFQRQRKVWQRRQAELQRQATEALEEQRQQLAAREQELAQQLRSHAEDEQRLAEDRARFAEQEASANESRRRQQEDYHLEAKRLAALEVELNERKVQPVEPAKQEEAIANPDDNGSVANDNASAVDAFRQRLADYQKEHTPTPTQASAETAAAAEAARETREKQDVNAGLPEVTIDVKTDVDGQPVEILLQAEDEIQPQGTKPSPTLLRVPDAEVSRLSNPISPSKQTALSGPRKWKTCRKQIRSNTGHAPDLFDQIGGGATTTKRAELFDQLDVKREGMFTHKVGQQSSTLECPSTPCIGEPTTPEAAAPVIQVLAHTAPPPGSAAVAVATARRPALSGGPSTVEAMVLPSPQRPALAALARFAAPIAQVLGLAASPSTADLRSLPDSRPMEPAVYGASMGD
jgi:hypothetical protein